MPREAFTLEELEKCYHMPLKDAAAALGTYEGAIIRACRRHNIAKWPYRQLSKINRQMRYLDDVLKKLNGDAGEKTAARRRQLERRYCLIHEQTSSKSPTTTPLIRIDGIQRDRKLQVSFLLNSS